MLVIAKFGGSSLATPNQFKKVKKIIEEDGNRRIIIVSALGKQKDEDVKLTDVLCKLSTSMYKTNHFEDLWENVKQRFLEIKNQLNLTLDLENEFDEIEQHFNHLTLSIEYVVSRGEYLTGKLMSEYIGYEFIDAKDVLIFKESGDLDLAVTQKKLLQTIKLTSRVVIPGFYGSYGGDRIHLFHRGGSDITGAMVARLLNASQYEKWTDVSGLSVGDPKLVKTPTFISQMTYSELRKFSCGSNGVIHEGIIPLLEDVNVPTYIKNTNDPKARGTLISTSC